MPKNYREMTDREATEEVGRIISGCSSEEEAHRRLEKELGLKGVAITSHAPTDQVGREARSIAASLGGLTMQNGAMVMFMAHGPSGNIIG